MPKEMSFNMAANACQRAGAWATALEVIYGPWAARGKLQHVQQSHKDRQKGLENARSRSAKGMRGSQLRPNLVSYNTALLCGTWRNAVQLMGLVVSPPNFCSFCLLLKDCHWLLWCTSSFQYDDVYLAWVNISNVYRLRNEKTHMSSYDCPC